jgi:hypothetical protein
MSAKTKVDPLELLFSEWRALCVQHNNEAPTSEPDLRALAPERATALLQQAISRLGGA